MDQVRRYMVALQNREIDRAKQTIAAFEARLPGATPEQAAHFSKCVRYWQAILTFRQELRAALLRDAQEKREAA